MVKLQPTRSLRDCHRKEHRSGRGADVPHELRLDQRLLVPRVPLLLLRQRARAKWAITVSPTKRRPKQATPQALIVDPAFAVPHGRQGRRCRRRPT
jgi:hypothetical protein